MIVEYIDREKIMCAVVLEVRNQRLRLLNESNREVNLSTGRLSHKCGLRLDLAMGRDKLVETLKDIAGKRKALIPQVDIKELWDVLNTEQEWIDLATMTEFCFPDNPSGDHESAVVRAFFGNRLYFKFSQDRFFPNPEEKVEKTIAQAREAEHRNRSIKTCGDWLKSVLAAQKPDLPEDKRKLLDILKSFYLFEKNSPHYELAKAISERAGIDPVDGIFRVLVKLGIWDENENIDLHRLDIPIDFPDAAMQRALDLTRQAQVETAEATNRRDLTALPILTIDGQTTLDFDDALSIERRGDTCRLGIHITDVACLIKKGDVLDRHALARGSSIYMPDRKIPMLPARLAEDLFSLKADEIRPAISLLVNLSPSAEIIDFEVVASLIRVQRQLTYFDVNTFIEGDEDLLALYKIAQKFRQDRFNNGAVQITLPEINVWLSETGEISINRTNRESPARLLVSELMIMGNWLMARFLKDHNMPALFRSQPEPRERLYKADQGTLFENWMQRKLLSRFVLSHVPEHHSGLGVALYTTATSPIRKYSDLVTQRQIRAVLGLETPYRSDEIDGLIQSLDQPMGCVARLQYRRQRFWMLKYLETRIGEKTEAIVLGKRRNFYQILMTNYMLECLLPVNSGVELKPKDVVLVTLQHVNARKDVLAVFMG